MQTFKLHSGMSNSTCEPTVIHCNARWYVQLPGEHEVKIVEVVNIPINRIVAIKEVDRYGCTMIVSKMYCIDDIHWIQQFVEG